MICGARRRSYADRRAASCLDEKSHIQALDRTQPGLPLKKGRCGTMTHDYMRNGTTTLFAAVNVLDGKVIGECHGRHRHQEWLKVLRRLDAGFPPQLKLRRIRCAPDPSLPEKRLRTGRKHGTTSQTKKGSPGFERAFLAMHSDGHLANRNRISPATSRTGTRSRTRGRRCRCCSRRSSRCSRTGTRFP